MIFWEMSNQNGAEGEGGGLGAECAGGIMTSRFTFLLTETLNRTTTWYWDQLAVLEIQSFSQLRREKEHDFIFMSLLFLKEYLRS